MDPQFLGKPIGYWIEAQAHLESRGMDQHFVRLASARAIMQKFVDKVDSGRARSTETYGEMTEWLKEE